MKTTSRKIPTKAEMDKAYFKRLDKFVDKIFITADNHGWNWAELARQSGLTYTTVRNLGNRHTKYPQLRTVDLIVAALGCRLDGVGLDEYRLLTGKRGVG